MVLPEIVVVTGVEDRLIPLTRVLFVVKPEVPPAMLLEEALPMVLLLMSSDATPEATYIACKPVPIVEVVPTEDIPPMVLFCREIVPVEEILMPSTAPLFPEVVTLMAFVPLVAPIVLPDTVPTSTLPETM